MERRPQNPEFRNNPENFQPSIYCNQQCVDSSFCLSLYSFLTCGDKLQNCLDRPDLDPNCLVGHTDGVSERFLAIS